jgi:hypothetical protein
MVPYIQDPYITWFMLQPGYHVETELFTTSCGGRDMPQSCCGYGEEKSLIDFPGMAYPTRLTH